MLLELSLQWHGSRFIIGKMYTCQKFVDRVYNVMSPKTIHNRRVNVKNGWEEGPFGNAS